MVAAVEVVALRVGGAAKLAAPHDERVVEQIAAKTERVTSTVDADLWSSPIFYVLLLIAASIEWYLRKKAQLK